MGGAGTAWGSWQSSAGPNLRGDWQAITVACDGRWERHHPDGHDEWRHKLGGWPELCSTVCSLPSVLLSACAHRHTSHPSPFPRRWPPAASACPRGQAKRSASRSATRHHPAGHLHPRPPDRRDRQQRALLRGGRPADRPRHAGGRRVSPSPIEGAKARHSIAGVAARTGLDVRVRAGALVTVRCPMPSHGHPDRTPSLRLDLQSHQWWCFVFRCFVLAPNYAQALARIAAGRRISMLFTMEHHSPRTDIAAAMTLAWLGRLVSPAVGWLGQRKMVRADASAHGCAQDWLKRAGQEKVVSNGWVYANGTVVTTLVCTCLPWLASCGVRSRPARPNHRCWTASAPVRWPVSD